MILPARPYQVRTGFSVRAWLWATVLVASALTALPYAVQWRAGAAQVLIDEKHIWEEGVQASQVRGQWEMMDKGVAFDDYRLDLQYTDEEGATRREKRVFMTIRALDVNAPVELRYRRGRPEQIALSAAVERMGDRWIAWYVVTALPAMMMVGVLFLAARTLRHWMDVRHAADRSDEVELAIDNIEQIHWKRTLTKRFRYHCRLSLDGGESLPCAVVFNAALDEYPIFSDEAQSRLVALVSPHAPRRPVIVRNDMYPFRLNAQQVKTMKERLGI